MYTLDIASHNVPQGIVHFPGNDLIDTVENVPQYLLYQFHYFRHVVLTFSGIFIVKLHGTSNSHLLQSFTTWCRY